MTPFDNDFLTATPGWLRENKKKTRVLSRSRGPTTLSYNAIGTFPRLMFTLLVVTASTGVGGDDSPRMTDGAKAAHIGTRNQVEVAWENYLSRLETPNGRFTSAHVGAVRTVWDHFRSLAPNLPPPQTAPTEDGLLSMVWNAGEHHLEVDVAPNRKVGWFYVNRVTGDNESREGSLATHLPRRLGEIVKQLA